MANPQTEDGFTRVANEIWEVVLRTKMNYTQLKILLSVWRYTYGFNRKEAELSSSFLAKSIECDRRQLNRELDILVGRKILFKRNEAATSTKVIGFNKDYDQWLEEPKERSVSTRGESTRGESTSDSGTPSARGSGTSNTRDSDTPKLGVGSPPKKENSKDNDKEIKDIVEFAEIVDYLNTACGTSYRASSKNTRRHINARLREGYSVADFKKVIDHKARDWLNDAEMAKFLRPETLFGSKFEGYLNQGGGGAGGAGTYLEEIERGIKDREERFKNVLMRTVP